MSIESHLNRYALIVGQGRSGTNWLNNLFDLSPLTFCRNEPHDFQDSPLYKLTEYRFAVHKEVSFLEQYWDDAIAHVSSHMGSRDHPIVMPKRFLYSFSVRSGLYRLLRGPKYRAVLSTVIPSLKGEEWKLPFWVGNKDRLEETIKIIKLVQCPGWGDFVLNNRPDVPVFHIVRHPGGFINSWANRCLAGRSEAAVLAANIQRLSRIVEIDTSWALRFGDFEAMGVVETELLYWLYASETIHNAGLGKKNYHLVTYEDLAANPQKIMRHLYTVCDLEWDESIDSALKNICRESKKIAATWKTGLDPRVILLTEKILQQSSFVSLWG
ncbi:MAG: sulfotransferase [Candidatus Electrothrix sp. AW3_4]|nr:sulfotransferase [Candidatus Electrothrix gigas]